VIGSAAIFHSLGPAKMPADTVIDGEVIRLINGE